MVEREKKTENNRTATATKRKNIRTHTVSNAKAVGNKVKQRK